MVEKTEPVECDLCHVVLASDTENIVHKVVYHSFHYCDKCDTLFDSQDEKSLHDDFLHAKFSCEKCLNTEFENENLLKQHSLDRHGETTCSLCYASVPLKLQNLHITNKHNLKLSDTLSESSIITIHANKPIQCVAVTKSKLANRNSSLIFPTNASSPSARSPSGRSANDNSSPATKRNCNTDNGLFSPPEGGGESGSTIGQSSQNLNLAAVVSKHGETISSQSCYTCNVCNTRHIDFSHLINTHQLSKIFIIKLWTSLHSGFPAPSDVKSEPSNDVEIIPVTSKDSNLSNEADQLSKKSSNPCIVETNPTDEKQSLIKLEAAGHIEVPPGWKYVCCSRTHNDAGLHLLIQHNLRKCCGKLCFKFLPVEGSEDTVKPETCHASSTPPVCTVCAFAASSLYTAVIHYSEEHQMQTCILCPNKRLRTGFISHLVKTHHIQNRDLLSQTSSPPVLSLVNSNLATYRKREGVLECGFCDPTGDERFIHPATGDLAAVIRHMEVCHSVVDAGTLLLQIYDGENFAYKNLILEGEEVCHAPLVNFNPVQEREQSPRSMENHLCIICNKDFPSSELVQVHLLADHINFNLPLTGQSQAANPPGQILQPIQNREIQKHRDDSQSKASLKKTSSPAKDGQKRKSINESGQPEKSPMKRIRSHSPREITAMSSTGPGDSAKGIKEDPSIVIIKDDDSEFFCKNDPSDVVVIKNDIKDNEEQVVVIKDNKPVIANKTADAFVVIKDEPEDSVVVIKDEPVELIQGESSESELEIDEEHFSINNVEVSIDDSAATVLEEADYCPVIDQSLIIDHSFQDGEDGRKDAVRILGNIGKNPVFLKCELCGVVLASILGFTSHMKREHKGCELERNKPYSCDICDQGFYFLSSLNSHRSKAHHEVMGQKYNCRLCPSVTNSKNGMRRHMKKSHGEMMEESLCYSCEFCTSSFPTLTDKKIHISETHKESVSVEKCFLCEHISPNKTALRRHFQRMHPAEPLFENVSFKCGGCDLLFPLKSLLTSHIKTEHPKSLLFQCAYCSNQFTTKKILAVHIAKHKKKELESSETSHDCPDCGKSFVSCVALKTHNASVHKTNSKERKRKRLTCKICSIKFISLQEKSEHMSEKHKSERPYLCAECDASFSSRSGLYNHKSVHKKAGQYTCLTCDKVFSRRDTYKEHVLIHNGPRHKCPHCPKDFVQRSNMKRHIRIHLGIKPYKCTLCDSSFSDKGACNSHMKTHTGEEREACQICGLIFSKRQKLKYHMRTHTGEGLVSCVICDKMFTHTYALHSHVKTHQKDNQFMCYICKHSTIKTKQDLYRHLEEHGSGHYPCTQCDKTFMFSKHLNRHIQGFHQQMKGFECSAETCGFKSAFLVRIRAHVQDSHSVKNPQSPIHFTDLYNNTWVLEDELCNPLEEDLYTIYESLDDILDLEIMEDVVEEVGEMSVVKLEELDSDIKEEEGIEGEEEQEGDVRDKKEEELQSDTMDKEEEE